MMMTAEQLRQLKRSVAEARETKRYVIESSLMPGFTFFYNVSDHGYGFNEPKQATLFHQRSQALAVSRLLGRRVRVVRYQLAAYPRRSADSGVEHEIRGSIGR